jgi:hypothetical protein
MQWRCLVCVAFVVVACRGSSYPDDRPKCADSIKARAASAYSTDEQKLAAYDTYYFTCDDACREGRNEQAEVCVERHLLGAELGDPSGFSALIALCEQYKHEVACRWMEAHPEARERIAYYEAEKQKCAEEDTGQERRPGSCYRMTWRPKRPERARVDDTPTSSASPPEVLRAVERIASDEAAQGFGVVQDLKIDMKRGSASFDLTIYPGLVYHVYVIGRGGMKFTTTLVGQDFRPIDFNERSIAGDVYVRAQALDPTGDGYGGQARVVVNDTVGAYDVVRMLVFKPN